ncbi:calcium-binding protein, partial [Elizabethkingia meningoseptica]|uniref:calcium-binding protein n=1 Tax=Elizabethkingia meningoseptica TaxID=238 RepID=UPI003197B066
EENGNNLLVQISGTNKQINLVGELGDANEKYVSNFVFADGSSLDLQSINLTLNIPEGKSTVFGSNKNLTINGNNADSTIYTGAGDDIVNLGSG